MVGTAGDRPCRCHVPELPDAYQVKATRVAILKFVKPLGNKPDTYFPPAGASVFTNQI